MLRLRLAYKQLMASTEKVAVIISKNLNKNTVKSTVFL
jgi:hypothetical protein